MDALEPTLPARIGRYQVVRLLGRGAMGRVLLAHDPVLDRPVALKLLRDDLTIPPEQRVALIERMRQEARASARVSHPNIVGLHDMGEDAEPGLYLVFEYAEGTTLKDRLTRGAIGPAALAKLARELGDALTTAHAAGVLHRDIKPENILLTATGGKIADFGIARVPDSTLTRDGGLLGTPAYSAPECIASGAFSPLSDQFSMAATLYEAVSQQRAFPGEDAVTVAGRIATEEPMPIAEIAGVDPHVDVVLSRALSKDANARYASARDFGEALAEALETRPRNALPTLPDEQHQRAPWAHRRGDSRSTRMAVGGIAVGALLGITGFQLSAGLRGGELPTVHDPAPLSGADAVPIGFLSEGPRVKAKAPGASNSARREAGAASATSRKVSRAEAAAEAVADAGARPAVADAGSSSGAGP
jgi:eukaryotic-like serine/threonine-protein kinase